MAMAGPAGGHEKGRQIALLAAAPAVQTITSADLAAPPPQVHLGAQLTQGAVGKMVFASIMAAVCFYYLHAGRRNNDPSQLFWSAVFALLTLACLAL